MATLLIEYLCQQSTEEVTNLEPKEAIGLIYLYKFDHFHLETKCLNKNKMDLLTNLPYSEIMKNEK